MLEGARFFFNGFYLTCYRIKIIQKEQVNLKCTVMHSFFPSHLNSCKFYKSALSSVGRQGILVKTMSVTAGYTGTP